MITGKDTFYFLFFIIYFTSKCVFTQDPQNGHLDVQGVSGQTKDQTKQISTTAETPRDMQSSQQIISIPVGKSVNSNNAASSENNVPLKSRLVTSQFVLEGGGIVNQTSTQLPLKEEMVAGDIDINHSKGSKGRKGVQYPSSPIVARKGVDQQGLFQPNRSIEEVLSNGQVKDKLVTSVINNNIQPVNDSRPPNEQIQSSSNGKLTKIPAKKPETVSDLEDANEFEEYGIRTSTTGEDYIIIGIVIVLGIWCSIFGALIFYRRAGEYWDRRHYRRMDFLVEGMYND